MSRNDKHFFGFLIAVAIGLLIAVATSWAAASPPSDGKYQQAKSVAAR